MFKAIGKWLSNIFNSEHEEQCCTGVRFKNNNSKGVVACNAPMTDQQRKASDAALAASYQKYEKQAKASKRYVAPGAVAKTSRKSEDVSSSSSYPSYSAPVFSSPDTRPEPSYHGGGGDFGGGGSSGSWDSSSSSSSDSSSSSSSDS